MSSSNLSPAGRPVWAEISLDRLRNNFRWLAGQAAESAVNPGSQPAKILAIVKANAYGHGLALCAPAVVEAGAEWLGVTSVEEGLATRALCPSVRILVISGPWFGQAGSVIDADLTPVVWERYHLQELLAAAKERNLAPGTVAVHLELDTGMSRQGLNLQNGPESIQKELSWVLEFFAPHSPLRLEGLMTHFSAPEDLASPETDKQLESLRAFLSLIKGHGLTPSILHAGSSATLLRQQHLAPLHTLADSLKLQLMLRPGLALYGVLPKFSPAELSKSLNLKDATESLKPVFSWKTRVAGIRTIPTGATAGYNGTFAAKRISRIALLPLGYADGLRRGLSGGRLSPLLHGQPAPIAGRISMDQTLLDITDIKGVEVGDEVVFLGQQGERELTLYDHADPIGAIPWEIPCGITERVIRLTTS